MIIITSEGHMTSTENLKELHRFAKRLGLGKKMFTPADDKIAIGIYSVNSQKKRKEAIKSGAKLVGRPAFILSTFDRKNLQSMKNWGTYVSDVFDRTKL